MIVVTGACGFIGSNLIKYLIENGEKNILAVDYVYRDYIKNLNVLYTPAEDFYKTLKKDKKIKYIFHEGAISSTIETDKKLIFKKNIKPTLDLIYYCRDNDIPLQYASSASVYGNHEKGEWDNPNKRLNPLNEYAKSKYQIDYVSNLIINSKVAPVLLQGMRYFNVYGPNEDHKENQSSPHHKFRKQLKEFGKIKLFEGSENYYRDFISVEQVIEKKIDLLKNSKSGIYDIGTGNPKSFRQVAIEICLEEKLTNPEKYIEWIPMPDNLKEHYQKYSKAII